MKVFFLLFTFSFLFAFKGIKSDYPAYPKFQYMLEDKKKYGCWGEPCEYYRKLACSICGRKYIQQRFCDAEGNATTVMYYSEDNCSYTRYHNNLKISAIEPCGCDDDINIGKEKF